MLAEVVTFILKKDGHEAAQKLMDLLEDNTTILFVDKPVLEDAKSLLRQYWGPRKRLSVCDATSCVLMRKRGTQTCTASIPVSMGSRVSPGYPERGEPSSHRVFHVCTAFQNSGSLLSVHRTPFEPSATNPSRL